MRSRVWDPLNATVDASGGSVGAGEQRGYVAKADSREEAQYRVWDFRGKSIVEWVVCGEVSIGEAVLALDATNPLRRRLVRPIGLVTRLAGRRLADSESTRSALVRERFVQAADMLSGELSIAGALIAPLGPWRSDRMCFIAVDELGHVLAFLKLRWGAQHDKEQLVEQMGHEEHRLPWLTSYAVPKLLACASSPDISVLALEVPRGRRLAPNWPRFVSTLVDKTPVPTEHRRLGSFDWFDQALEKPEIAMLRQPLLDHRESLVGIGAVHADMRPSNLMETAEGQWILDWETWTAGAPWAADILMAASVDEPDRGAMLVGVNDGSSALTRLDVLAAAGFLSTHLQPSVAATLAQHYHMIRKQA